MSFFNLSDGTNAATQENAGTFEMGGGNLAPIPDNTNVVAFCEEAKLDEYDGDRYISLKWRIQAPKEFKNRIIFQKIRTFDLDATKRDKAIRMLVAIDSNAGGKLVASGQEPNDMNLGQCLLNKPMVLKLMVWEMNDKSGNWVGAVSKYNGQQAAQPAPVAAPTPTPAPLDIDGDIPF